MTKKTLLCTFKHEAIANTINTVKPPLRGHPEERPTPLERPLDNVNLNINVLISTPDERPPLLKGHLPGAKGVASQEGFNCTITASSEKGKAGSK